MTESRGGGVLNTILKMTLAFFSLLDTGMSIVKVDIRCYCNLPVCVATGHMCRSRSGMCASESSFTKDISSRTWLHACLELLSEQLDVDPERQPLHCGELRRCCTEDMCNYFGVGARGVEASLRATNQSHVTGYLSNSDTSLLLLRNAVGGSDTAPDSRRPLLFRFAVIVVPLAGCLVLAVLVFMAARMLRVERHRQTRLKPADTVVFRRRNLLPKSLSCVLPSSSQSDHVVRSCTSTGSLWGTSPGAQQHVYRSSSISLAPSTDSGCTDTSREKYFVFDV